jgi:hypothetical protein
LDILQIIKDFDSKAKDLLWQNMNENIDKDYIISLKNTAFKKISEYK